MLPRVARYRKGTRFLRDDTRWDKLGADSSVTSIQGSENRAPKSQCMVTPEKSDAKLTLCIKVQATI
jgi:hypothetical protein